MGYITIGILVLTAIALLFGTLFGMKRGRNRSILRLILIIGCVVGAIFLRPVLTDIIMDIDTGEGTLAEMLASSLSEGGDSMPASMTNMLMALIQIIFGLASYLICFFVLRFVSWLIIFPICKIFVKKDLIKKRGWGALIGLVQGIVIAFAVVVPLNGLAVEVNKLSVIKMEGKPMIEMPAEVGIDKHGDSLTYRIYDTVGGWYYDILTTAETKDGDKITLSGTCSVLGAMFGTIEGINELSNAMTALTDNTKTNQEKADALGASSAILKDAGKTLDGLDKESKKLFNQVLADLKDMMGDGSGEETGSEGDNFLDDLSVEKLNFTSIASGLENLAKYVENPSTITQEEVNKIVNGISESELFLEMLTSAEELVYDVDTNEAMFKTAIESTELTIEQKSSLKIAFGVN